MNPSIPFMASAGIALQGFPLDHNSSYLKGAAGAPPLIRKSLFSEAVNRWTENGFDLEDASIFRDLGDMSMPDRDRAFQKIEKTIQNIVGQGLVPVSLGGDHSITYPIVRALKTIIPEFAILHFDAHPDLYESFQNNPHSHACPFARIMGDRLVGTLVQVGIRTLNGHQKEQAEKFGVAIIQMKDWSPGKEFEFNIPLYISVDIDVLDPSIASGVSHYEPGGFSSRQLIDMIQRIRAPLIIGADVVEFNPQRDPGGITAMICAKMVKEIAGKILEINRIGPGKQTRKI
jgi:arginase